MTFCAVVTVEAVAVKLALVAPAATVTEAGTETAVLLLVRDTASPPLPAAADSDTVQESVPPLVSELLLQVRPLSVPPLFFDFP